MKELVSINLLGRKVRMLADKGRRGRIVKLMYGKGSWIGAGYIGGFTAFLALGCVSPRNTPNRSMYVPRPLQVGITCNGNAVPFTSN